MTVTDVNDNTPEVTSNAVVSIEEGTTRVVALTATDADVGDTVTFTVTGGADVGLFEIDTAGVLRFENAPDFEQPFPVGGDNEYVVIVTATDTENPVTQEITVTVTDVNDNTPEVTSNAVVSIEEGNTQVQRLTASDADAGSTVTFSVTGGADVGLFEIDTAGVLRFKNAPDFEAPGSGAGSNVYVVVVTATDSEGALVTQEITVTVTDANDNTPEVTSNAVVSIEEGTTRVVALTATDADAGDTVTFSVADSGADRGLFEIDTAGVLSFTTAPSFESPSAAGGGNAYAVTVKASDGTRSVLQPMLVTVTNVNNNEPVVTSPATVSVAEGQVSVQRLTATDGDVGDTVSFTVTDGADRVLFEIDGMSGELRFKTAPDFETPGSGAGTNVYVVVVTATDSGGALVTQEITVTVTDANDNFPRVSSAPTVSLEEGTTRVVQLTGTDGDTETTVTFTLTDGADHDLFEIDPATNVLRFKQAPDFENPVDVGGNNIYEVTVQASDGTLSVPQPMLVIVTNINDNDPVVTSPASVNVAEGQTPPLRLTATDADGDTVTFTVTGGADRGRFVFDPARAVLSFKRSPDFEAPVDADRNNVYEVVVTASDVTRLVTQSLRVTVTNINDNAPVVTSPIAVKVAEGRTTAVRLTATDADGDTVTFTVTGGADRDRFLVETVTGQLRFKQAPDFETPADTGSNNVYEVVVTASDGSSLVTQTVTVTVTDVVEFVAACARDAAVNHGFTDVLVSSYAYRDVGCIKAIGVTTGTSATTYSPQNFVTREQMAAFLARLYRKVTGEVCRSVPTGFTDVPVSSYAYRDVGCIKDLGVTTGTSATTYSPQNFVTREQMAAFLARLYRKVTGEVCRSVPTGFTDVPVSSYAYRDVGCINDLGVTTGTSATTYSPQNFVTREQMAAFLARLYRATF